MDNSREVFANNFNFYLERSGMSQKDLACKIQMSPSIVSDWSKGIKYPRVSTMQMIADVLGVTMYDLTIERSREEMEMTEEDKEFVRIFKRLKRRERVKIMAMMYDLDDADNRSNGKNK